MIGDQSNQEIFSLDNEDVDKISLEELIDKLPNLVNEYDLADEKLIRVLKRRDILESLIRHVTETPADHLNENERFKYANQSCVLFTSKNSQMESELIQHKDLLDRLINFLNTDDELNPLMASFFANTLYSIYCKFTDKMIQYFNEKTDFLDLLFKHIHISAIMDFLIKITTLESINSIISMNFDLEVSHVYKWLNSQNIDRRILDVFKTNDNQNALENTSSLLIFLIQKRRQSVQCQMAGENDEQMFNQFHDESFLTDLVDTCFSHRASAIHILRVLVQFVDCDNYIKIIEDIKKKFESTQHDGEWLYITAIKHSITSSSFKYLSSIKTLHKVVLRNLDKFKTLLIESVPDYSIQTTTGFVQKPLGFLRLEIIQFFYTLLLANNPAIDDAFAKHQILSILIDLFFEYEFNSFLHNHVNNIVTTIFLNANQNRFKLLTNEQEKANFLELDTADKWKNNNLSLIQMINLIWSDHECVDFVNRNVSLEILPDISNQDDFDSISDATTSQRVVNPFLKSELEYTNLVAQLFDECNLVERIMNKYKSILNQENPLKAVPSHKSNLIDIGEQINNYLNEYEKYKGHLPEKLMQKTNFAKLKEDWIKFSNNELMSVKNKIIEIEQSVKNQIDAEQDLLKYTYQHRIGPIDFESPYVESDYKFSRNLFETDLEKKLRKKLEPEIPVMSMMMNQSMDYFSKFKGDINTFQKKFDEERSIEDDEKQKEMKSTSEDAEQYSQMSEQISSLTDRENIFQPLASSSNISNELNIEMDIEDSDIIKEEDDNQIEVDSAGDNTSNNNQATESKDDVQPESSSTTEMQQDVVGEKNEDEDWADFGNEPANN